MSQVEVEREKAEKGARPPTLAHPTSTRGFASACTPVSQEDTFSGRDLIC